jgi:hypothetical protein
MFPLSPWSRGLQSWRSHEQLKRALDDGGLDRRRNTMPELNVHIVAILARTGKEYLAAHQAAMTECLKYFGG